MTSRDLIKRYFDFFEKKGHVVIPSASLIPENDSSVLFTTAGMHPLVPFLLGEEHPGGKRLVDVQLCLRTDDIDEVGDPSYHTFFEMLGNWSLGDYWKKESQQFSYDFLTKILALNPERLWVTCFEGDSDAPKDLESAEAWEKIGIPKERIFFLPKKDNWWGPVGDSGPCGPDSEIYYDVTRKPHGEGCHPGDHCGRFFEIWNNVFMQYNKTKDEKFEPLKQKNVDTGMGVDRTMAVVLGVEDDYKVPDLWEKIIRKIEEVSDLKYEGNEKAFRIIADHVRAAVFAASEGIEPSNKERGYILRRLIRRAVRYGKILGIKDLFLGEIVDAAIETYGMYYPRLRKEQDKIKNLIVDEEKRFILTIVRGLREIEKVDKLDGKIAFFLYETYGFPVELTEEIAEEKGQSINKKEFEKEFGKHKELSRTASAGMFKGGLAGNSEEVTKLHTVTHLIHAALRKILGDSVSQKGSNITSERLRFDFSHDSKLSDEELKRVENLVNEKIKADLPVTYETMSLDGAIAEGALHFFGERYGKEVKVYTIGAASAQGSGEPKPFSREVCGGPHVSHTGKIGRVKIIKQEKVGAGVIRLYASLANSKS